MKRRAFGFVAAALLAACGPQQPAPETSMAPEAAASAASAGLLTLEGSIALTAQDPADAPALMMSRTVDQGAEGQDGHVMVRLEAGTDRYLELHERNHTPYDVTAQAAGGALATAIGAGTTAPVLYEIAASAGAPLVCGATTPAAIALYEDAAGGLVIVGLTVATFEGTENDAGITIAPLPPEAVCGRATYRRG